MTSYYRNRKLQRLLLNLRLKLKGEIPIKEIELPKQGGAKLPPLVNLPSDDFNLYEKVFISLVILVIAIMLAGSIIYN